MTNAWVVGKFWTYIEVEHVQGPDINSLYPANTRSGGLWVKGKRWHGLVLGRGENLFWGSYSSSFGRNVMLG